MFEPCAERLVVSISKNWEGLDLKYIWYDVMTGDGHGIFGWRHQGLRKKFKWQFTCLLLLKIKKATSRIFRDLGWFLVLVIGKWRPKNKKISIRLSASKVLLSHNSRTGLLNPFCSAAPLKKFFYATPLVDTLDQRFPIWGICTPGGTFAYLKGYIYG